MALHDAHNHLQDEALAGHLDRIAAAWPDLAGPQGRMVVNGTHPDDWPRVAALAARYPFVLPAYGLHPWDVGTPRPGDWLERLRALLAADPRASVGEIGLDRWMIDHALPDDPRLAGVRRASLEEQIAAFIPQLALAAELDRPASIHCLRAYPDLLPLLRSHPLPRRGFLLHAYSGPADLIPGLVRLGACFSFNPNFLGQTARPPTSSNPLGCFAPAAKGSKSAVFGASSMMPLERLLCETDAPAMAPPQPWRTHKLPPAADGTPINHPGNIEAAYAGLATVRGLEPAELSTLVDDNFTRLFGR